jgi:hypothetical protein
MALIDTGRKVTSTRRRSPLAIMETHMAAPGTSVAFEQIGGVVVTNRGDREAGLFLRADGAVVADVPIELGAMPTSTADLIAKKVLTRTYIKSAGGLDLVRMCSCQYGPCGHCSSGSHDKCTTRVGFHGKPPKEGADTYVQNRRGHAIAPIRRSGTDCRWWCPCTTCTDTAKADAEAKPTATTKAHRAARGDLRIGDTVWLTPKTLGAPTVCWSQPRATVVRIEQPTHVVVQVDGVEHEIHVDNIRRTDPAARKPTVPKPRRQQIPDGFTADTLF